MVISPHSLHSYHTDSTGLLLLVWSSEYCAIRWSNSGVKRVCFPEKCILFSSSGVNTVADSSLGRLMIFILLGYFDVFVKMRHQSVETQKNGDIAHAECEKLYARRQRSFVPSSEQVAEK